MDHFRDDEEIDATTEVTERVIRFSLLASRIGRSAAAFELAPWVTGAALLARQGLTKRDLNTLDEDQVSSELWRVIEALAAMNVYLCFTDHLSDRHLYARLMAHLEEEPLKDYAHLIDPAELTQPGFWSCHVDLTRCGDPDDGWYEFLQFYASEADREIERRMNPTAAPPEPCPPPHDRDCFLPRAAEDRYLQRGELPPADAWFDEGVDVDNNPLDLRAEEGLLDG